MGKDPVMGMDSAAASQGMLGKSPEMAAVRRLIEKSARHRLPVLLLGETGTGKEVAARAIHAADPRGAFVPIDCGALVGNLMESELFGHTKGAFSGAVDNKKGLVEMADGGTAFFDEIGELPLDLQVKLLRLIQEREFRPVGALQWRKVDVRIVAATHRDLKAAVAAGRFREDLFYRLNVFPIRLPPLRDRRGDIPLLAAAFAGDAAELLTPEILHAFCHYDWPGNVRELKHCVERMVAMRSEGALRLADAPSSLQLHIAANALEQLALRMAGPGAGAIPEPQQMPLFSYAGQSPVIPAPALPARVNPLPVIPIPEAEKQAIAHALRSTRGSRSQAAELLKISRTTLYRRMKEYGFQGTGGRQAKG